MPRKPFKIEFDKENNLVKKYYRSQDEMIGAVVDIVYKVRNPKNTLTNITIPKKTKDDFDNIRPIRKAYIINPYHNEGVKLSIDQLHIDRDVLNLQLWGVQHVKHISVNNLNEDQGRNRYYKNNVSNDVTIKNNSDNIKTVIDKITGPVSVHAIKKSHAIINDFPDGHYLIAKDHSSIKTGNISVNEIIEDDTSNIEPYTHIENTENQSKSEEASSEAYEDDYNQTDYDIYDEIDGFIPSNDKSTSISSEKLDNPLHDQFESIEEPNTESYPQDGSFVHYLKPGQIIQNPEPGYLDHINELNGFFESNQNQITSDSESFESLLQDQFESSEEPNIETYSQNNSFVHYLQAGQTIQNPEPDYLDHINELNGFFESNQNQITSNSEVFESLLQDQVESTEVPDVETYFQNNSFVHYLQAGQIIQNPEPGYLDHIDELNGFFSSNENQSESMDNYQDMMESISAQHKKPSPASQSVFYKTKSDLLVSNNKNPHYLDGMVDYFVNK